jgi:hypothetical protein
MMPPQVRYKYCFDCGASSYDIKQKRAHPVWKCRQHWWTAPADFYWQHRNRKIRKDFLRRTA